MKPRDFLHLVALKHQAAVQKAVAEGRLLFVAADEQGQPCNGGKLSAPVPLGEWAPVVDEPEMCRRGYHATTDPLLCAGSTVWLCELDRVVASDDAKSVGSSRRVFAQIRPGDCKADLRLWTAASRPKLADADLRKADLRWADLRWADLHEANLCEADLRWADLRGADLRWADLRDADLRKADLRWADLRWADLHGADLSGADLSGADVTDGTKHG